MWNKMFDPFGLGAFKMDLCRLALKVIQRLFFGCACGELHPCIFCKGPMITWNTHRLVCRVWMTSHWRRQWGL